MATFADHIRRAIVEDGNSRAYQEKCNYCPSEDAPTYAMLAVAAAQRALVQIELAKLARQ